MGESSEFEDTKAASISGQIMVAAIIVLFLVIVFVLFLHLYAKWFWRRRADGSLPSQNNRRRFMFAPGQDPVVSNTMRRGLDPSVIMSLPLVIFHSQEFKDGLECAVCLCELSEGEIARVLPKCNHGFHVDCIDMWFQSHSTCPLCRNPVDDDLSSPLDQLNSRDESPSFPTNVLIWGNQTQVSSCNGGSAMDLEEEGPSSSSSSSSSSPSPSQSCSSKPEAEGALVIEIPRQESCSSLSPSSAIRFGCEEVKSPGGATRLRTLKRLLSRETRVIPCSPSSVDVERGNISGQDQSS